MAGCQRDQVVHCVGADDLTRGHEAAFLTQLDRIDPVDPRKTKPEDLRTEIWMPVQ